MAMLKGIFRKALIISNTSILKYYFTKPIVPFSFLSSFHHFKKQNKSLFVLSESDDDDLMMVDSPGAKPTPHEPPSGVKRKHSEDTEQPLVKKSKMAAAGSGDAETVPEEDDLVIL